MTMLQIRKARWSMSRWTWLLKTCSTFKCMHRIGKWRIWQCHSCTHKVFAKVYPLRSINDYTTSCEDLQAIVETKLLPFCQAKSITWNSYFKGSIILSLHESIWQVTMQKFRHTGSEFLCYFSVNFGCFRKVIFEQNSNNFPIILTKCNIKILIQCSIYVLIIILEAIKVWK